jgi:hypothetical protein
MYFFRTNNYHLARQSGQRGCNYQREFKVPQSPEVFVSLQTVVDRFKRSLILPSKLFSLHSRVPGTSSALNPAILLSLTSAFEGFAEDFLATALLLDGFTIGQVADAVGHWNNPTLKELRDKLKGYFPSLNGQIGVGFTCDILEFRTATGLWLPATIDWEQTLRDASTWMQVRHSLSHGVVTGWKTEAWPRSTIGKDNRGRDRPLLYRNRQGRCSVVLQCARNCAVVYVEGSRHLVDLVAVALRAQSTGQGSPLFGSGSCSIPASDIGTVRARRIVRLQLEATAESRGPWANFLCSPTIEVSSAPVPS